MSCPFTRRAFDTGFKTKNGKSLLYITTSKASFIFKPKDELGARTQKRSHVHTNIKITKYVEIPCGHCEQCQAKQAKEKCERACAEAKQWKHNAVINLTYDNEHVPITEYGTLTLKYEDFQLFKKRLLQHYKRKYDQTGIRFMVAGEYGETYARPHYHAIFFNLEVKDLKEHGKTKKGSNEYLSDEIQKLWGKGYVTIGDVTQETIQYVANYCLKKVKGSGAKEYYAKLGIEPEFVQSSRNPGIGANWLENNKQSLIDYGKAFIGTNLGVMEIHPNQYFDRKLEKEQPELLKRLKEKRKNTAEMKERTRALISGLGIDEQRYNDALNFHDKIKKAKCRNTI